MVTMPSGVRQFHTILHWEHEFGPAHCLARMQFVNSEKTPTVVVSEIWTNKPERGITYDFPPVAEAFLGVLPANLRMSPESIVWIAHFGEFSSYEDLDAPDSFVRVMLNWDGAAYHGSSSGHHRMKQSEAGEVLRDFDLTRVPEVLRELKWIR